MAARDTQKDAKLEKMPYDTLMRILRNLQPRAYRLLKKACGIGALVFLLSGLVLIAVVTIYLAYSETRFLYGISVSGMDVGGKTIPQARKTLEDRLQTFSSRITLDAKDQKMQEPVIASLDALGVSVLMDDALHEAFVFGHQKNFLEKLRQVLAVKKSHTDVPLRLAFDDNVLDARLLQLFGGTLETPATNADVSLKDGLVFIAPSRNGAVIDRTELKKELNERISGFVISPISLKTAPDKPRIDTEMALLLKKRVERILAGAPYFLFGNNKRFVISRTQILEWLSLVRHPNDIEIAFSREALESYLLSIAPSLAREADNVRLGADERGKAFVVIPSQDALRLNVQKTTTEMISRFEKAERSITALLDAAPARINELLLKERGITHLVGRGESSFAGSPRNRIQNIRVASEKYRGLFIEQGEEFSFGVHLGQIDAAGGYVPELVIKNNKFIPEYGGGICQVSTTLFRAAVFAGLNITKRINHSIPVRYYGAPGFDATVYPPNPDLAFINTATGTLFVQPRIEGAKLVFELYGKHSEKEVKVEGPRVVEAKSDGSIRTVVTQKVFEGGALVQQKSFWSLYKSPELYKIERNPLE